MGKPRPLASDQQSILSFYPYSIGHAQDGISLLMRLGPYRILLDCGLNDIAPLQTEGMAPADVVFCSHAHADHARGLLDLHQSFPKLPIYTSEVTAQLLPLNWPNESLDADFYHPLAWRSPIQLFENLTAELLPAGHLPGAAMVLLTYTLPKRTYKVLYTGDFSLSNLQLVEGLSIETLRGLAPDVLIIESSYGTRRHPHRRQQEKQLMQQIDEALQRGQSVLLPVPILGVGQEILKLLRSHHQFTGRDLDIWVTGRLVETCDRYEQLIPQLPLAVQNFAKHQPLFWDERVCPRLRSFDLKALPSFAEKPCVVLTDNLSTFFAAFPEDRPWRVLVSEDDSDRFAVDFPQKEQIQVESYLLADHSDVRNTTQLIHNLRPQHVIFVHGSSTDIQDLTGLVELQNRYQLHSPASGNLVELPIGEQFIQPTPPVPSLYEGEVSEIESAIAITLDTVITQDSRWYQFADTGIVEARWQGEELVLRGISQRELRTQAQEEKRLEDLDCCSRCLHYRHQRCWNPLSPLAGFRVTPEGYCPVFESLPEE
ncbi:MAG: MBL fold metallo-hydrolase [Snowella sp.]|nr:MBL fold metallo-hydrolase [Snowella sp.]